MFPTDFYAGAIAAFVVILFTKSFTHRQRQPGFGSGNRQDMAWWIGHWICERRPARPTACFGGSGHSSFQRP